MTETTVGTGMAPADITLDLGDLHPSGHGALLLHCRIDGDAVISAEARPGLLHRGTEKLMESRDYRQALMLANRHDWLGAAVAEIALATAIEELLGLEVPARAVWLRTLLCEINRASAALLHLAGAVTMPPRGLPVAHAPGIAAREAWLRCLESMTGGRVHPMVTRIGGLAHDAPESWTEQIPDAIDLTREAIPTLLSAIELTVPEGIAVLDRVTAEQASVGGPVARASGLDEDLRRDSPTGAAWPTRRAAPMLAYPELVDRIHVVTAQEGDARARYRVLAQQVLADLDLIAACWARIPDGPIDVRLPKVVRAPEGQAYAVLESAMGPSGAYVVSAGEVTPWRVRLRTASYANVQAMGAALPGTALADLPTAVGSFLFVAGDLDH